MQSFRTIGYTECAGRKIINDINPPPFVPSSSSGLALSTVEGLREDFQHLLIIGAGLDATQG
jgi:hypothetical protein